MCTMNSVMNSMSSYPFSGGQQGGLGGLSRGYGPPPTAVPSANMNPKTSFAIHELLGLSSSVGQPQGFGSSQLPFGQDASSMNPHHHYAYPHQNYSTSGVSHGQVSGAAGGSCIGISQQALGGGGGSGAEHTDFHGMAAMYNSAPWRSAGFFSSLSGSTGGSARDEAMNATAGSAGMAHLQNSSVTSPRGFGSDPLMSPDKHNIYHHHTEGKSHVEIIQKSAISNH